MLVFGGRLDSLFGGGIKRRSRSLWLERLREDKQVNKILSVGRSKGMTVASVSVVCRRELF